MYMGSLNALFEELVSKKRFTAFPWDCKRDKEFVARVEYQVPSISAFVAGGNPRNFMKRLAVHEVANVLAEGLQRYKPRLSIQLRSMYPDPRRPLDAWLRRTTGMGDLARVYQRPEKPPLRNRSYFDR